MAILNQDAYLENDRYYKVILVFPEGSAPALADLNAVFTENNVWYWDLGSGVYPKYKAVWRLGYLRNASMNLRPRGIAETLGAIYVGVDNTDVSAAVDILAKALELWAPVALGVNPSAGATLGAQEILKSGSIYACSADWGSAKAPSFNLVVNSLADIGVEVQDIDACGSFDPIADTGSPFGNTVNYFPLQPGVATFTMRIAAEAITAGAVRDALGATVVYIPSEPKFGIVDAALLNALCPMLEAVTHIAFAGSRFSSDVLKKVGKIADVASDPFWIKVAIGVSLGLGVVYFGYRAYYSDFAKDRRKKR